MVGREVGVKCYGMEGCFADGRPGVTLRSCRAIIQVSASAKRNKSRSSAPRADLQMFGK